MHADTFHPEIGIGDEDNQIYYCRVESHGEIIIHRELNAETNHSRNILNYRVPGYLLREAGHILIQLASKRGGKILRDAFENPVQPLCTTCLAQCPVLYIKSFKDVVTA